MKDWLTVEEAAVLVSRTKWAIYKWIHRGKITGYETDTGTILVHSGDLLATEAKTKPGRPAGSASHNGPRRLH